jgi:hypothetical protein
MYKKNASKKGNLKLREQLECIVSGLLWTEGKYKMLL